MPPQTLASMARLMPAWMARSQISGPQAAISSLLAVTTDLRLAMAALTISAATRGAAHQFGDDLHVRVRHHLAPVGSLEDVAEGRGNLFGVHRAAAHGDHLQAVPELESDLVRVLGQDGKRAGPDVAQADDANIDFLHILP